MDKNIQSLTQISFEQIVEESKETQQKKLEEDLKYYNEASQHIYQILDYVISECKNNTEEGQQFRNNLKEDLTKCNFRCGVICRLYELDDDDDGKNNTPILLSRKEYDRILKYVNSYSPRCSRYQDGYEIRIHHNLVTLYVIMDRRNWLEKLFY